MCGFCRYTWYSGCEVGDCFSPFKYFYKIVDDGIGHLVSSSLVSSWLEPTLCSSEYYGYTLMLTELILQPCVPTVQVDSGRSPCREVK